MSDFTHIDDKGNAIMVDVSKKDVSDRTATAKGSVIMEPETLELIMDGGVKKGDVLSVAQIAGIMGAKKTPDLIPLCHPLNLSSVHRYQRVRAMYPKFRPGTSGPNIGGMFPSVHVDFEQLNHQWNCGLQSVVPAG